MMARRATIRDASLTLSMTPVNSGRGYAVKIYQRTKFVWHVGSTRLARSFVISIGLLVLIVRPNVAAQVNTSRQQEWEQTVRAAEKEGQVTVSIGGYGAIIDSGVFQKAFPKIKITSITGAGTDLTARI